MSLYKYYLGSAAEIINTPAIMITKTPAIPGFDARLACARRTTRLVT